MCLDDIESLEMKGFAQSEFEARFFGIQLHRCTETENCKSSKEIDDFIKYASIGFFYNSQDLNVN